MNKQIIIIGFCIIISLHLVLASQEFLGEFKVNEDITLLQTCSACSFNNITTVTDPVSNIILQNKVMTKSGLTYNYTLPGQTTIGSYYVCGVGDLSGTNTVWCYSFDVTQTGNSNTSSNNYLPITLVILGVLFILILFSKYVDTFIYNFEYTKKNQLMHMEIPLGKLFIWSIVLWLLPTLISVGIQSSTIGNLYLNNTIKVLYFTIITTNYIVMAFWLIFIIYWIIGKVKSMAEEVN